MPLVGWCEMYENNDSIRSRCWTKKCDAALLAPVIAALTEATPAESVSHKNGAVLAWNVATREDARDSQTWSVAEERVRDSLWLLSSKHWRVRTSSISKPRTRPLQRRILKGYSIVNMLNMWIGVGVKFPCVSEVKFNFPTSPGVMKRHKSNMSKTNQIKRH